MPDFLVEFATEFNLRSKIAQLTAETTLLRKVLNEHRGVFVHCADEFEKMQAQQDYFKIEIKKLTADNNRLQNQLFMFARTTSIRLSATERRLDNHDDLLYDLTAKMRKLSLN